MTMTNTSNQEFINGFLAGQMGKPTPPKASEEWLKAYTRGYETEKVFAEVKREIRHGRENAL